MAALRYADTREILIPFGWREGHPPTCVTVICTGTSDEARIKAAEALAPDALLRKPVDFRQVREACCPSSDGQASVAAREAQFRALAQPPQAVHELLGV